MLHLYVLALVKGVNTEGGIIFMICYLIQYMNTSSYHISIVGNFRVVYRSPYKIWWGRNVSWDDVPFGPGVGKGGQLFTLMPPLPHTLLVIYYKTSHPLMNTIIERLVYIVGERRQLWIGFQQISLQFFFQVIIIFIVLSGYY